MPSWLMVHRRAGGAKAAKNCSPEPEIVRLEERARVLVLDAMLVWGAVVPRGALPAALRRRHGCRAGLGAARAARGCCG